MNDKELLELAAKAAEIMLVGDVEKYIAAPEKTKEGGFITLNSRGGHSSWNPLADDGDALRLAIVLGVQDGFDVEITKHASGSGNFCYVEPHNDDPHAATRRAIVRAAAEIGKNLG